MSTAGSRRVPGHAIVTSAIPSATMRERPNVRSRGRQLTTPDPRHTRRSPAVSRAIRRDTRPFARNWIPTCSGVRNSGPQRTRRRTIPAGPSEGSPDILSETVESACGAPGAEPQPQWAAAGSGRGRTVRTRTNDAGPPGAGTTARPPARSQAPPERVGLLEGARRRPLGMLWPLRFGTSYSVRVPPKPWRKPPQMMMHSHQSGPQMHAHTHQKPRAPCTRRTVALRSISCLVGDPLTSAAACCESLWTRARANDSGVCARAEASSSCAEESFSAIKTSLLVGTP